MVSRIKFILVEVVFVISILLALYVLSYANYYQWAEGGPKAKDGASRDYYNLGARLAWSNFMGDWADSTGMLQGLSPYSQAFIKDTNSVQEIEWDVTDLVKAWVNGTFPNNGFFLHALAGKGTYSFRSREYMKGADQRPKLKIVCEDGYQTELAPEADTYLTPSSFMSVGGKSQILKISTEPKTENALIRFHLGPVSNRSIKSAKLKLTTFAQSGSKSVLIGVFRCQQVDLPQRFTQKGIADRYDNDIGIQKNADVVFATGFEKKKWAKEWSSCIENFDVVDSDPENSFEPIAGKALRLSLLQGSHWGGAVRYRFLEKSGHEPEKIFFRYYLRLGDNWNQTVSGGKLPGFRGTYNKAGWGGRKPNGYDGWSARGAFIKTIQEKSNPLYGMTPIGYYCYYADQPKQYGDGWIWNPGKSGFPTKNRWYCIEQYVEMNTPGVKNGILKAWVDGYKVFEKKDILFRLSYNLKVEMVTLSLYHGGGSVSPYNQDMYIDNVVIAKKYIGPGNFNRAQRAKEE